MLEIKLPVIKIPSRYIARNGESFVLLTKTSDGNYIGARDFFIFDGETLNAIEPKDENLDLIEWDIEERKRLSK